MSEGVVVSSGEPEVHVEPATAELWGDVSTVFGTRGDPSRCWCQWFRMRNADWRQATTASNRSALRAQLDAASAGDATPPGLIAYVGGEPVGWCAVAPRAGYPRVIASAMVRTLRASLDDDPDDPTVWSITCFVVRVGARRRGIARALLGEAITFAASHGADVVEAYPVDVAARDGVSSSELYHGSAGMFAAAGFAEVARSGAARPVVRLDITAQTAGR